MDKICLELSTFEEFTTAVLQTVAKRCVLSHDHFFESAAETNDAWDESISVKYISLKRSKY